MTIFLWVMLVIHILAAGMYMVHMSQDHPRVETRSGFDDFVGFAAATAFAIWIIILLT